jgi:hypothetical protein
MYNIVKIYNFEYFEKVLKILSTPEPEVIKEFHPKEGVWEDAEQLLNQLVAFYPIMKIFLQTPVLFIEKTPNPEHLLFKEETVTIVPSLFSRGYVSLAKLAAATP